MKNITLNRARLAALVIYGSIVPFAYGINCGDVIGPHQSVKLTGDLTCSTNPALTVIGPATLNLGGHTVRCNQEDILLDGFDGIILEGENVALINGTVSRCSNRGVALSGEGNHRIKGVTATDGTQLGNGAGVGFSVESNGNRCANCVATQNFFWGFLADGRDDNKFVFSQSVDNGSFTGPNAAGGFATFDGSRNQFINCIATGNFFGFVVFAGEDNRIVGSIATGNRFFNSQGGGFDIYSSKTTLAGIIANDNGHFGGVSLNTNDNKLTIVTANNNDGSGVVVEGDHNTLTAVTANNNSENGVRISGNDNRIIVARAKQNGKLDLQDDTNCASNVWRRPVASTKSDCIP